MKRVKLPPGFKIDLHFKDLGLIVIDEEQDASYRQEESPFYNARDSAIVRAQKSSASVVL